MKYRQRGSHATVTVPVETYRLLQRIAELEQRPLGQIVTRAASVYRRWLADLSEYTDPRTADPEADGPTTPVQVRPAPLLALSPEDAAVLRARGDLPTEATKETS